MTANQYGLAPADVAHLKAGDEVTVRVDAAEGGATLTGRAYKSGTVLYVGPMLIRDDLGHPGNWLVEVVSPKPPAPEWPVGTRLTDGERCAILAGWAEDTATTSTPWVIYMGPRLNGRVWLTEEEVEGWPLANDHPEVVELPEGVELARDGCGHLWVRTPVVSGAKWRWRCLSAPGRVDDDWYAANWTRVAVAPKGATS